MLLKIVDIQSGGQKSPSTSVAIFSDSTSSTSNKHNVEPAILSILCWNVQVYEASKAESNQVVNSVIHDVLKELGVDIGFLLETREHPDVNLNFIESKPQTDDLDYQQIGSDLTGSLRCPPERLYLWEGGTSTSDVNYTEEKKKSWRILKWLSEGQAVASSKDEEKDDDDGPADWRGLYTTELFRYYDLYRVKPAKPADADWNDIGKIGKSYCLLDQDRNVIFTSQKNDGSATYLVFCKDVPAKTKPRSEERKRYTALSRGRVNLEKLRDASYTLQILDPPGRERVAHDELDDFNPDAPYGLALLDGSDLKSSGEVEERMVIFEYKGSDDGKAAFEKLYKETGSRWFKASWRNDYRGEWSSQFHIYLATARSSFSLQKRNEWRWISVPPPPQNDEGEIVFRLRRCGKCHRFLGDPYGDCEDCLDFRHGTERENLRQALQACVGGAGWSGLESYSVLVRCKSSEKAGSVIPLAGKKATVLRSANRLLDLDANSHPLGYVKPVSSFYGRCPFLLPIKLQTATGIGLDVPVIAFHAPYGEPTKAGIKARADAMQEIFRAQMDPFAKKRDGILEDHESAIVIGDFNLDPSREEDAKACYRSYKEKGLTPQFPGEKTSLQKLGRPSWEELKKKKPETGSYLSSAYDNVFVKGDDLLGAIDRTGVVDVIDYIKSNLAKYCKLVEEYFEAHPKSGKKADWNAFKEDKDLKEHTAAYIYGTFVSDHLPVLINLKAAAGNLEAQEEKEDKEEKGVTPWLWEKINGMLLDLGFEEGNLEARIKEFEDSTGASVTGRINWVTYWRMLARYDPEKYEKEAKRTERQTPRQRRQTMGPSDFAKQKGLAKLREEEEKGEKDGTG